MIIASMVVSKTAGDATRRCVRRALSCNVGLAGTVGTCFRTLACSAYMSKDLAFVTADGFTEVFDDGDGVTCNINSLG